MNLLGIKELKYYQDNYLQKNQFSLKIDDLYIDSGETIGMMGRSGAGKTTLARLMAGIVVPTSGMIKKKTVKK